MGKSEVEEAATADPTSRAPRRSVVVALVLASATLITLDYHGGGDSPVEPVRHAVGEVFGPVEGTTAAIIRPFALPDFLRSTDDLRQEVARLEAQNAQLRRNVETATSTATDWPSSRR